MPGYQYLDNNPRMDAIQQIGQTGNSLATSLPQLQLQAQAFRQRLALQRAQELLNEQRMNESKARAKLYEGEQKLNEFKGDEVKARTSHVQGQEQREQNIAQAAFLHGQYAAQVAGARQQSPSMDPGGEMNSGGFTPEQSGIQGMLQAAGLLMQKNPQQLPMEMNALLSGGQKPIATRPGEVLVDPQTRQPFYTNTQSTAKAKSTSALDDPAVRANIEKARGAQQTSQGGGFMETIKSLLGMGGGGQSPAPMAATNSPAQAPTPGTLYKGYRFKGGDPAQQQSWEKVQ